jgi:nucleoside-diphosphate-sugar epimerase
MSRREVLVTGATGFLGKLLLRRLVEQSEALGLDRIHVLIRPMGERITGIRRFDRTRRAGCFAGLPEGWHDRICVVEGDLTQKHCGLSDETKASLVPRLTHIIHGAAAVDFDLPPGMAAQSNVTAALRVQDLAREGERLEHLVHVSTAYVTPHAGDTIPIEEHLVSLPRAAQALYRACLEPGAQAAALLEETRHPNTYTLTKCLTEHLLAERRGTTRLSVVRPSIISASWREPFPGWIDSATAFAGFVVLVGSGEMRVVVGHPAAQLDVVPVDWVAERVVSECFSADTKGASEANSGAVTVRHLTAGLDRAPSVATCKERIVGYFTDEPVGKPPRVAYLGPRGARFAWANFRHQRATAAFARFRSGDPMRARRTLGQIDALNQQFSYFTQRSFDFQSSAALSPEFDPAEYVTTVSRGVARHLLRAGARKR